MILIIGAGVSGMTLAYELQKKGKSFLLLEKSNTAGGYIKTDIVNGYQLELGPNSFLADQELLDFFNELELQNEIQFSNEVSKSRYVYKKGAYRKLPGNPITMLFSDFFSFKTKYAIIREFSRPKQEISNETLGAFFERRFSKEIVDYALDPFVSGIYAGNVDKLSLQATFSSLKKYEEKFGSVLKGFLKNSKTAARKKSLSFKRGMQAFTDKLYTKINDKNIVTGIEVKNINKNAEGWKVTAVKNDKEEVFKAQQVVLCLPSYKAGDILNEGHFRNDLLKIRYVPMGVVHTVYEKEEVGHPLNGFGGLNPTVENQFSLGSIWTSSLYPGRCAANEVLFTTFVGGERQKDKLTENTPEEIQLKVHQELAKNFKIKSPKPVFQHYHHWEKALPQYENSILDIWTEVNQWEKDGLFVCSNWKDGVSLSDCIKKSKALAAKLSGE